MDAIVVLEWTFSPSDYFEEEIHIKHESYTMVIGAGKVEARVSSLVYVQEHEMQNKLHASLNNRFLGVQLVTYKPYELSKPSMYRLHADGRRDYTLFAEPAIARLSFGNPDLIVKDKDGNILRDSRRARIEKKKKFSELVEKYREKDIYVRAILGFQQAAIHDPENELVHLYDIWETLKKPFKTKEDAKSNLKISQAKLSLFVRLCNDEPLNQGRHRGKNVGELRDATEEELVKAREIATKMIEAYLYYLETRIT